MEILLQDGVLQIDIDEEIVFHQLSRNPNAIWSLMLASGYSKIVELKPMTQEDNYERYTVGVTNLEVKKILRAMVHEWFCI